jgi:hypothetical protein
LLLWEKGIYRLEIVFEFVAPAESSGDEKANGSQRMYQSLDVNFRYLPDSVK